MKRRFYILFVFALLSVSACAAIPLVINHQGVVQVSGAPFTGTGLFRFAIFDPGGGTNLWTNDGTVIGTAGTPVAAVSISVTNGLYSVALGDTSLTNMTALTTNLFSTPGVALRVWFNDGVNGVLQLAPDHVLTSAPYAFHSSTADTANSAINASNGIPSGLVVLSTTRQAPAGFSSAEQRAFLGGGLWAKRAPVDVLGFKFGAAVLNGRIHLVGGNHMGTALDTHIAYNPTTNQWTHFDPLPTPRYEAGAVTLGGKIHVIGGRNQGTLYDLHDIYDPGENSWSIGTPLPTIRSFMGVVVLNGKIHVLGGGDDMNLALTTHDVFDPGLNSWSSAAPLPSSEGRPEVAALGGKIYLFTYNGETYEYDPGSNSWSPKADMPNPARFGHVIVPAKGRIFLIGGVDEAITLTGLNEEYDPVLDRWTSQPSLPRLRNYAAGASVDDQVYVMGGLDVSTSTQANEAFTPPSSFFVLTKD
jgi:hypothetical protein